eukprot:TRINITY_DN511_c0_g1_i1.p1 TRINITY_DN511_c0_g1~~TRINITY_DN511_c0_g1_i1.p1  ORF type:complete len:457 (-),score=120.17 TRINITY_DN511_c0_g1_i1:69-1385(-)
MAGSKFALLSLGCVALVGGRVHFSETFGEGWETRWTLSTWKEQEDGKQKMGRWTTSAGRWFRDEKEDAGLHTADVMKFYSISAPFDSFSNKGSELIIQYQAKYEKDLGCGGGYLKVGPKQDDLTKFGDPTPYNIMFGPDQCNADKRTHLIFSHGGKNFLKKSELPYKQEGEGISHLYRLVLRPDSTVLVEVDQEKLYEGSLKEDWDMLPSKEIPDPNDKKPTDWADEEQMDDPKDVKPADWVDEKRVRDPSAKRPDEWDDDEDGEWEAPLTDNPAFKGEWVAKRISNPAYKGAWEAKKIANPDFVDEPELYSYGDFGYVGFDVWQVKGGTIFDNIIITDSVDEANAFAEKWKKLSEAEQAAKKQAEESQAEAFAKARAARAARAAAAKAEADAAKGSSSGDAEAAPAAGAEAAEAGESGPEKAKRRRKGRRGKEAKEL